MSLIRRCAGTNGVIELYPDHLKIHRPGGCLSPFPRGEKMIPYSKLSGVQFKPAGNLAGFVQFIFSGSSESKGNTFDAAKDENTVLFALKEQADFTYVRDFVQDRILHPPRQTQTAAEAPRSDSIADIERLAKLRDQGIITEDEFQAKKRQLLGL